MKIKEISLYSVFFIGAIVVMAQLFPATAKAGLWNDITTAITGHVDDAQGRLFGEHEVIEGGDEFMRGTFNEEADGQDAAHWATGSVSIILKEGKRYVQLNTDFNSGPLPDGHVYISLTKDINNEADFNSSEQVDLGSLKLGKGASFYEIPAGMGVGSVTIWCKAFGEYIGSANVR